MYTFLFRCGALWGVGRDYCEICLSAHETIWCFLSLLTGVTSAKTWSCRYGLNDETNKHRPLSVSRAMKMKLQKYKMACLDLKHLIKETVICFVKMASGILMIIEISSGINIRLYLKSWFKSAGACYVIYLPRLVEVLINVRLIMLISMTLAVTHGQSYPYFGIHIYVKLYPLLCLHTIGQNAILTW